MAKFIIRHDSIRVNYIRLHFALICHKQPRWWQFFPFFFFSCLFSDTSVFLANGGAISTIFSPNFSTSTKKTVARKQLLGEEKTHFQKKNWRWKLENAGRFEINWLDWVEWSLWPWQMQNSVIKTILPFI